ncbi:MAG: hypothetical protein ACO3RS_10395 [Candidatus Puniceispirillaceae bacterium]
MMQKCLGHNWSLKNEQRMKQENHSRFMMSERAEKLLKNLALILGLFSAVAVVFDLYPLTMFLSLPFCLIWIYCGWLRTEPQLKWINVVFFWSMGRAFYAIF